MKPENHEQKIVKSLCFLFLYLFAALPVFFFGCSKPTNACFTYSQAVSQEVMFNAACSENSYSFRWTFGDGTTELKTSALWVEHTYDQPGTYTVTLNAERKDGVSLKKGKPQQMQSVIVW